MRLGDVAKDCEPAGEPNTESGRVSAVVKTISHIKIKNFLSLKSVDLGLGRLNVLVGPNGAGKTNLLKMFQFLGDVARIELAPAITKLGGFSELLFRSESAERIEIELFGTITKHASTNAPDEYKLSFWPVKMRRSALPRDGSYGNVLIDGVRRIEELKFKRTGGRGRRITLSGGRVTVGNFRGSSEGATGRLDIQDEATGLGTLRRLSNAVGASEWNSFAEVVEQLRLFEIDVEKARQPSALTTDGRLKADGSNIAGFLLWLSRENEEAFKQVCDDVRFVLPGFDGFAFTTVGGPDGAIRVGIKERGIVGETPLARTSFGTIRSIALFSMLQDPNPPTLTCLEEVDHGLHPHALDRLVERLRQASAHTQLILATHSPALVNRLSAQELIVVERDADLGSTRTFRPDSGLVTQLAEETDYQLGELWFSGALGGGL